MQTFMLLTSVLVPLTGLWVMGRGDWRELQLKYAGVVISTVASIWFLASMFMYDSLLRPCSIGASECFTIQIYAVARNISFIIFHLAVGRDARGIKTRGDRRRVAQEERKAA